MRAFIDELERFGLHPWREELSRALCDREQFIAQVDRKGQRYLQHMEQLPEVVPSCLDLDSDWVEVGREADMDPAQHQRLIEVMHQLSPWRKGPFRLFGTELDTEWVSYLKWNRLKDQIAPLGGRNILDIGSSCGYYLFRMAQQSPKLALGIEPYLSFYFQFQLLQHYIRHPEVFCLPLRLEDLPPMPRAFDSLFCMGILYHRRSPADTLQQMHGFLRRGGELVLETLVIEGEGDLCLCPKKRYAKMNNVYFLPTLDCLSNWLERAGFENIRCIDVGPTTATEQRKTSWIQTESLEDFLDPEDPSRTIEGYPAPVRAVFIANAR